MNKYYLIQKIHYKLTCKVVKLFALLNYIGFKDEYMRD